MLLNTCKCCECLDIAYHSNLSNCVLKVLLLYLTANCRQCSQQPAVRSVNHVPPHGSAPQGQHGDSQGEVPVSVFQRSVVRLFRLMKMDRQVTRLKEKHELRHLRERVWLNVEHFRSDISNSLFFMFQTPAMGIKGSMLMIQADEFSADEYDVDGSGAVGWYEFVTVWRKAEACRQGFPSNLPTTVLARIMLPVTLEWLYRNKARREGAMLYLQRN